MSEATQLTQISDNVNQGYIAGRDLYLGDQYVAQETLYFEPDLKDVEPPAWTTTPKARELAEALFKQRLIVLAGQDLDDKTMVARHLAWLLRQSLQEGEILVREWYRSSDPQKIETAFHPTVPTILLLPQVQPHHVGHRLNELGRLLQTRSNYLVITTEQTREEWGIRNGSPEDILWHEISWESYYGRDFLADLLLQELTAAGKNLPEGLPRGRLQTGSLLAEGLTVEAVAVRLRQPDRIRRFAQWFLAQETASSRDLLAQLDQLGGDKAAIFHWFRQLDHNDQLLALGLVLFDGLPDDQAFAGVEYLVSEAWRKTDPNLPLFDYQALGRLSAYFHLSEAGQDGARIEIPSRQKREAMLQAAWELQRRRLLSVVPALTHLIKSLSGDSAKPTPAQDQTSPAWRSQLAQVGPADKASANNRRRRQARKALPKETEVETTADPDGWRFTQGAERELSSSPRRVEQLQRSVIESLSQIGLLSFEAIEASFLELAANGSTGVQTVVAKALAAWRGEGHHDKVFRVLQDWWAAGCRATLPKPLAQKNVEGADPLAGIRATVMLAVGYSLQYDPPNQLSRELLGLLQVGFEDTHPSVRQRILELTLPLAAASHPEQLEALLRHRLLEDQEQMYAIAFGIAMAYSLRPLDALRIVDRWHLMVRSQGARQPDDLTITARDRLLAAVALIYGYVRTNQNQDLLSPTQAVSELRSILTTESHPFVRTHALMAMGLQAVHNFEIVASMLIDLISEIALPDRANVISIFSRAYLNQREQLSGGDGEIEIDGHSYQIWTRTPRPLTAIEISLYAWLRDNGHPVARQVAVQAFAAFAATALERREREIIPRQTTQAVVPVRRQAIVQVARKSPRLRLLSPLAHLAVLCAAPRERPTRSLLRPVLAEVIEVEREDRRKSPSTFVTAIGTSAPTVIEKWRRTNDENMQSLAHSLRIALHLFRWRWVILLSAVWCGILLQFWGDWNWSHSEPLPQAATIQIQQQKTLPLRLIWQQWVPLFQKYQAEKLAALEKAVLKAAGQKDQENVPVLPPSTPGPVNRMRRAAEQTLTRLTKTEEEEFREKLLEQYRQELAKAEKEEKTKEKKDPRLPAAELLAFLQELPSIGMKTPEQELAEEILARAVVRRLAPRHRWATEPEPQQQAQAEAPPQETVSDIPFELPGGSLNLPSVLDSARQILKGRQEPARAQAPGQPASPQAKPAPSSPSWVNRLFNRKKKTPPPGGNHGNG